MDLDTRTRDALPDDAEQRLLARAQKSVGCWIWCGGLLKKEEGKGYGRIRIGGAFWLVHRLAWTLEHGPIPEGLFVCHHCDNPSCVRVEHLFLGTARDNREDMIMKGRAYWQQGRMGLVAIAKPKRLRPGTREALLARYGDVS